MLYPVTEKSTGDAMCGYQMASDVNAQFIIHLLPKVDYPVLRDVASQRVGLSSAVRSAIFL